MRRKNSDMDPGMLILLVASGIGLLMMFFMMLIIL